jgi:hypothetical protein
VLFNFLHYAMRPWPWIIVALVSLVQFPMTPPAEQGPRAPGWPRTRQWLSSMRAKERMPAEARAQVRQRKADAAGVGSLARAFPKVDDQFLRNDIAYPGMISTMPKGGWG